MQPPQPIALCQFGDWLPNKIGIVSFAVFVTFVLILGSYLSKHFLYKMTKQKQANENCSKLQRRVKWQKITTNYCSSLLVKIVEILNDKTTKK